MGRTEPHTTTDLPSSTDDVVTRDVRYYGVTVRETAGSTATVVLRRDGSSGSIIETIGLAANESVGIERGGTKCDGIHATISGTIEGAVYHS